MPEPQRIDAELLAELAPLVRVITTTLVETPVRIGTVDGAADLGAALAVRIAAWCGRNVLPLDGPADRAQVLKEAAAMAEEDNATCNSVGSCRSCEARSAVAAKLRRAAKGRRP